jgi:aromatic ring-opening dioxygenase LigB subunit
MQETVFSRAVFMCHAPIVIPPIGGNRAGQCAATSEAMQAAAKSVVDAGADRVLLLDPHLLLFPNAYTCVDMPSGIKGSFKQFGRPDLTVEFPRDPKFNKHLIEGATEKLFVVDAPEVEELDHGALVPLWFLQAAGFKGSVSVVGFPWRASQESHIEFGRLLGQVCGAYEGKTALLASGDMSHRLQLGAPSGFHPNAHVFDKCFAECVGAGELAKAAQLPEDLRDLAAEDASESMAIAAGAVGDVSPGAKVLSYEAPFGVGYMVAILA